MILPCLVLSCLVLLSCPVLSLYVGMDVGFGPGFGGWEFCGGGGGVGVFLKTLY